MFKQFKQLLPLLIFTLFSTCYGACELCPDGTRVLFVNNSNTLPGNGSLNNPYSDLSFALSQSNPCDVIYVFPGDGPYDGSFQLLDNQRLLGTTDEAFQLCPLTSSCTTPTLINTTSTTVVKLANNNEVSGFTIISNPALMNNAAIAGEGITNALITDNSLVTYQAGKCVFIFNAVDIGTVTITRCNCLGGDLNASLGILIFGCFAGSVEADHNFFGGTTASTGLSQAFTAVSPFNHLSYSLTHNTVIGNTNQSGAFIFATFGTTGSQSINITDNAISLTQGSPSFGILCYNELNGGTCCLNLLNNTVVVPSTASGYVIWNASSNPFYFNIDNSNKGTLTVNAPILGAIFPPPMTFTPVSLTTDCEGF